jgi:hypothetical protein
MPIIASINQAELIPRAADSKNDEPYLPATNSIPDTRSSMPVATNHCKAVTVTVEPASAAGQAVIEARAGRDGTFYELELLDTSAGTPVSARLEGPIGQIRVTADGVTLSAVYVQGEVII